MKMHTFLLPVLMMGLGFCPLVLHGQSGTVSTRPANAQTNTAGQIDQGYIRLNGQNYVVVGNVAYPIMGDITQRITPESAAKLRDGYMLNTQGNLVPLPSGLTYYDAALAAPTQGGENVSGLAPDTNVSPNAPANGTAVAPTTTNDGTSNSTQRFSGNTNGADGTSTTTNSNTSTTNSTASTAGNGTIMQNPDGTVINGTLTPANGQAAPRQTQSSLQQQQTTRGNGTQVQSQPQVPQQMQQNGTQPMVPQQTQQNGTQPQVTNGAQPNGTIAPQGQMRPQGQVVTPNANTNLRQGQGTIGNGTANPGVGNGTAAPRTGTTGNGTTAPSTGAGAR